MKTTPTSCNPLLLLFIGLWWIYPCILRGQSYSITVDSLDNQLEYRTILKHYPTDMITFTPGLVFGVQQQISEDIHGELALGYLYSFDGRWAREYPTVGFISRLELMIQRAAGKKSRTLLGMQVMYKQFNEERIDEFDRFDGSFRQTLEYRAHKRHIAVHAIALWQSTFARRWMIEIGFGLGLRSNFRENRGIPDDAQIIDDFSIFDFDREGYTGYPSMHLRLGVGYSLN